MPPLPTGMQKWNMAGGQGNPWGGQASPYGMPTNQLGGGSINVPLPPAPTNPGDQGSPFFYPSQYEAWQTAREGLGQYYGALRPPEEVPDLVSGLKAVGPYQEFDWRRPSYTPPQYQQFGYQMPEAQQAAYQPFQYQLPDVEIPEYQRTQFDFAERYRPPEAYQPFQFAAPEVEQLRPVEPIAREEFDRLRAREREEIGAGFEGQRQRMEDISTLTGGRPEQMAALMATLGQQEEAAKSRRMGEIGFQEAMQRLGIAQQERELGLTRGVAQAGLSERAQENQAQEMARKYGMDIDDARYLVGQQAAQQQVQAGENLAAAQYGRETAGMRAGMQERLQAAQAGEGRYGYEAGERATRDRQAYEQWLQTQRAGEGRYGYEQAAGAAREQAAYDQWLQEQQAGEKEKAYLSRYGLAQDVGQAGLAGWQAGEAAKYDYANALLSGQQAGAQQFGQAASFYGNLSEAETVAARKEWERRLPVGERYYPQRQGYQAGAYGTPSPQQEYAKKQLKLSQGPRLTPPTRLQSQSGGGYA